MGIFFFPITAKEYPVIHRDLSPIDNIPMDKSINSADYNSWTFYLLFSELTSLYFKI